MFWLERKLTNTLICVISIGTFVYMICGIGLGAFGGRGFILSLSEWSFTICPTPYNLVWGGETPSYELKERRKEMFYLTTHSTHFLFYGYMASDIW